MDADNKHEVTRLLQAVRAGDRLAADELFTRIHRELERLARWHLRKQSPSLTLQTTDLVDEAVLKLLGEDGTSWENRGHLLAVASRAMRCILVDHARAKNRDKRRPNGVRVPMEDWVERYERGAIDLVELDEALNRLQERDERMARLVELRFFGGRTMEEVAACLGMSLRSAEREWQLARAWLKKELE